MLCKCTVQGIHSIYSTIPISPPISLIPCLSPSINSSLGLAEDVSLLSDDGGSVTSPDELAPHPGGNGGGSNGWSGRVVADYVPQHEVIHKGPQKAEIQLRWEGTGSNAGIH